MKIHPLKLSAFYGLFVLVRLLFQRAEDGILPILHQIEVAAIFYLLFGLIFLLLNSGRSPFIAAPGLAAALVVEKFFIGKQTVVVFVFIFMFLLIQSHYLKEERKGTAGEFLLIVWGVILIAVPVLLAILVNNELKDGAQSISSIVNFKMNWPYFRYFFLLLAGYGVVLFANPSDNHKKSVKDKHLSEMIFRQREVYFLSNLSIAETAVFIALRGDFYLTVPVFDLWVLSLIMVTSKGDYLANAAVKRISNKINRFLVKKAEAEK